MALGAEMIVRRPFPAGNDDGELEMPGAPVFLATDKNRPVDPMIWGDEKRMKRELVAWAKAVASMVANTGHAVAVVHQAQGVVRTMS